MKKLLKQYYGYSDFRPGQKEIIDSILAGKDTLAIMPTGGGKSLCYQIPSLMFPGLTVVVSPLIALMEDQVQSLDAVGIPSLLQRESKVCFQKWKFLVSLLMKPTVSPNGVTTFAQNTDELQKLKSCFQKLFALL